MMYNKKIQGKFVSLRSITLEDAEFSYNLRKDPRFIDIMGQAAPTLEDQKKFIEWQMKQPGDYYFVVENRQGERIGLIGVYDIHGDVGECGRVINIGAPYETMETEILLCDFCMNVLHLKKDITIVYKHNKKKMQLKRRLGQSQGEEIIRNGVPAYRDEEDFSAVWNRLSRAKAIIDALEVNES